ncbi:unnamed protein product [Phytomonas sp. Hart1]|nr:unnamed protein product [Phytomonas sp. Hart1]|eukprot:CCW68816.1 unnamed protein product [Phytomonas sp. isolate Hart1]
MFLKGFTVFEPRSTAAARRAIPHARGDSRKGKQRFSLAENLYRDRIRVEQTKALSFKDRLRSIKAHHCLFFVGFMIFWSWLGNYSVPYLKGTTLGNKLQFQKAMQD